MMETMNRRSVLLSPLALPWLAVPARASSTPLITHGQFTKTHSTGQDMFWHWRRNDHFSIALSVDYPAIIDLRFSASLRLKAHMQRMSVAAVRACLRGPARRNNWPAHTDPFHDMPPEIPGCFWRENILPDLRTSTGEHDRHKYATAEFSTLHYIQQPGFYRVEIWSRARSSWNKGSLPYETGPDYELPPSEIPPGPRGSADGNVIFELDPYDADNARQPQNHLTVELRW
jgi:hypothetical protein